MAITEVTSQSWLGRLGEAFKGILVGIAFFVGSFFLLWWNEGRAVKTEKSLQEGQGAVVSVANERVDPLNEHKLVHLSGHATTAETLSDPEFMIARNAIKLRRTVEMYQWKEDKKTEERKKMGGGSEKVTTYTYAKEWTSDPIDSASFKESGHDNPGAFPFSQHEENAKQVTLGAFQLDDALVGKMDAFEPVPVDDKALAAVPEATRAKLKLHDSSFYIGEKPDAPAIGDVRVKFSAVSPQDVSVVAVQQGNSFGAYHASAGMDIEMLRRGVIGAKEMFQMALKENSIMTWVLRGLGWFLMFLGLVLFFRPLSVVGDVVPMIGSFLAFGTGLAALAISVVLSIGTIGVAWVVFRPVLGITLLAAAIGLCVWVAMSGKKKVAAKAAATAAQPA
jgi:hypothetical protein